MQQKICQNGLPEGFYRVASTPTMLFQSWHFRKTKFRFQSWAQISKNIKACYQTVGSSKDSNKQILKTLIAENQILSHKLFYEIFDVLIFLFHHCQTKYSWCFPASRKLASTVRLLAWPLFKVMWKFKSSTEILQKKYELCNLMCITNVTVNHCTNLIGIQGFESLKSCSHHLSPFSYQSPHHKGQTFLTYTRFSA